MPRKIKLTRGAHYTEAYADTFQVTVYNNKKFAELFICEEIPYTDNEITLVETENDNISCIKRDDSDEGIIANRIIHARIKVTFDGMQRLYELLGSMLKDNQKEK